MFPAVRAVNQEPRQISGADRRKGLCARGIRGTAVVAVVRHESVTSAGRRPELVRVLANRGRRRRSRAGMSEIVGFAAMMCRLSLPPTQPATGAFVNSTEATFHYGYRAIDPRVIGRLSGRRRVRLLNWNRLEQRRFGQRCGAEKGGARPGGTFSQVSPGGRWQFLRHLLSKG